MPPSIPLTPALPTPTLLLLRSPLLPAGLRRRDRPIPHPPGHRRHPHLTRTQLQPHLTRQDAATAPGLHSGEWVGDWEYDGRGGSASPASDVNGLPSRSSKQYTYLRGYIGGSPNCCGRVGRWRVSVEADPSVLGIIHGSRKFPSRVTARQTDKLSRRCPLETCIHLPPGWTKW